MRWLLLAALLLPGCAVDLTDSPQSGDTIQEVSMAGPLFVRNPYMQATRVNASGDVPAAFETVAGQDEYEATTLLIETVRFWFTPAPSGGRTSGVVQIGVLTPDGQVMLEQHEIAEAAEGEYPEPVVLRLDLMLPPGYELQVLSDSEAVMAGVPAICHVIAQGGELG